MKRALTVFAGIPAGQVFIIPVRLDRSAPFDDELQDLNWIDLYPDYDAGLSRILASMSDLEKDPLEYRSKANQPGARAPIFYTPYRPFADFARDFVERLPRSAALADAGYAIYLDYLTAVPGVIMPQEFRYKHPFQIKIVLQHAPPICFAMERQRNTSIRNLPVALASLLKNLGGTGTEFAHADQDRRNRS